MKTQFTIITESKVDGMILLKHFGKFSYQEIIHLNLLTKML